MTTEKQQSWIQQDKQTQELIAAVTTCTRLKQKQARQNPTRRFHP